MPLDFLLPNFQELSTILPKVDEDNIFSTPIDYQSIRDMWLNYIKAFIRDQPEDNSSDRYSMLPYHGCLTDSLCLQR